MEELLTRGFAAMDIALTERALERFRQYYALLDERNRVMNLTAISGEEDTAKAHFLDSCSLLRVADFAAKRVIDVGTGAGFPGLPLKIAEESIALTLLDSQQKRTDFLTDCVRALELEGVEVICSRAEDAVAAARESYDIAVSRAVARLNVLCELCLPFVRVGGLFIAMKGTDAAAELAEAANAIATLGGGEAKIVPCGAPGTQHAAVIVKKLTPSDEKYPRRWAKISKKPL